MGELVLVLMQLIEIGRSSHQEFGPQLPSAIPYAIVFGLYPGLDRFRDGVDGLGMDHIREGKRRKT